MQGYSTAYSNTVALVNRKTANQKKKIYFTGPISKYFNTPSIGPSCKFSSFDFFSRPYLEVFVYKTKQTVSKFMRVFRKAKPFLAFVNFFTFY
ncbi:hypothetical protein DDZ16_11150 [Marinilabilia rubra]|uniref:Uncharacterized protein n=1 Tax=Marinilabilia rubra TaxID=2162893 RepID=A0A2U2B7V9_9BACT|nr:hypothetical protein DDZ16_11150 [Marinilabilia rubra]